jgi:hypothetical protein
MSVNGRGAAELRSIYPNISGSSVVAAADTDSTLVAAKASHTIFVQRIIAYVSTDAAQSWSFEGTAGRVIAKVTTSPGVDTRWDFDFGDEGVPLAEGDALLLNASAAGLAGNITWYGYRKLTSAVGAVAYAAL